MSYSPIEVQAILSLAARPDINPRTIKFVAGLIPEIHERIRLANLKERKRVSTRAFIPLAEVEVYTGTCRNRLNLWVDEQDVIGFIPGEPHYYGVDPGSPGSGRGVCSQWWTDQQKMEEEAGRTIEADTSGFVVTDLVPLSECHSSVFLQELISPINTCHGGYSPTEYKFLLAVIGIFGGLPDVEFNASGAGRLIGACPGTGGKICKNLVASNALMERIGRKYKLDLAKGMRIFDQAETFGVSHPDVNQLSAIDQDRRGWLAGVADMPPPTVEDADWVKVRVYMGHGDKSFYRLHRKVAKKTIPSPLAVKDDPDLYGREYWKMMKVEAEQ